MDLNIELARDQIERWCRRRQKNDMVRGDPVSAPWTPGPWVVQADDAMVVRTRGGFYVADTAGQGEGKASADAALIALSPDWPSVMERLVIQSRHQPLHPLSEADRDVLSDARALLAKLPKETE